MQGLLVHRQLQRDLFLLFAISSRLHRQLQWDRKLFGIGCKRKRGSSSSISFSMLKHLAGPSPSVVSRSIFSQGYLPSFRGWCCSDVK